MYAILYLLIMYKKIKVSVKIPYFEMAEEEGFEPPLGRPTAGFQDRSLQPDLGIPPYCLQIKCLLSYLLVDPAGLEPATNRL